MGDVSDDSPLVFADDSASGPEPTDDPWKVLVVDDEEEVHRVTRLVLGSKTILGRRIQLFDAWSSDDGYAILAGNDIACVLLDVVMESEDAGLRLVRRIREELKNGRVRIILRTGQPGHAPESSVIERYEINDYKEKTELTVQKLITAVTAALRSYRDIETIEQSRVGMRMIIEASASIYRLQSLRLFATGVLQLLVSLLRLGRSAAFLDVSGFAATVDNSNFVILAGTGKYEVYTDRIVDEAMDDNARMLVANAVTVGKSVYAGDRFAVVIQDRRGRTSVLYVEHAPPIHPLERELIDVSCANITSAFGNIMMYSELETLAAERAELIREVHHRVKNNLQVISSLVDLAAGEGQDRWLDTLTDVRDRIQSMAVVHDRVYEADGVDSIDFGEVARTILENAASNEMVGLPVEREVDFGEARLSLGRAIPCALLYREIVANGLRRAAASPDAPHISVSVKLVDDGASLVITMTAGSATGASADDLARPGSLSDTLVRTLVEQVGGRYDEGFSGGGGVTVTVPLT